MTTNSVGWVLLDGPGVDAATLDHGIFDVSLGSVENGDTSKCLTAIQAIQTIAATGGDELKSIGLTWTADAATAANTLLTSLPDLGFEKVVSVRLSEAASRWAQVFGASLGFERAAVCVIESLAVTLLSVGHGGAHISATYMRESDDGLARWLKDEFETNNVDPEHLFLIGSRGEIGLMSGRLGAALDMSVTASREAQLILARGAALMVRSNAKAVAVRSGEQRATLKENAAALAACVGILVLLGVGPMLHSQLVSPPQDLPVSSETSMSSQAVPPSPAAPPADEVAAPMVQPAPALPSSAPSPPVTEVTTPEASLEPLADPEMPAAAVPTETPATDLPQEPAAEELADGASLPAPAEGANVPAPAEGANVPAPVEGANVPTEIPHLPAEGTPHLPGAGPLLAAEAPVAEATPTPTP
ncbi:MAG: hypothetical protein K2X52_20840 [Mycobacteriaceae bacterium]|nr:hypothetical protein [Mycobacteriaceae bacterium]